jgi:acetyl esterase
MPMDPQIAAFLAAAPPWPPTRSQPLAQLRAAVRSSSMAFPALNVPLARVQDQNIPAPGGPIRVRIYTPRGDGPFPLITYFHGGGFVVGDLDTQDNIARALAFGAGAVVVSVDYRLAPEHPFPAGADDCWFATCWCAEHAQDLNADATRHAVAGDSAGANMSAGVALRARDRGTPRLAAQLLFYGSCDYPSKATEASREFANGPILTGDDVAYFWELYLRTPETEQNDPIAAPVRARDHRGVAPAFVGTAEIDPTRDHGEAYARKLDAAGVTTQVVRYKGMVHGFVSWLGVVPAAQSAIDDACAFFSAQCARQEHT